MFAKIKHLAIVSEKSDLMGEFYRSVLRMKSTGDARASGAVVVGDGYIGLNFNPRKPGRQAGLDHFGFEVEDVEVVFARIRENFPSIEVLKRPGNRPFAGISTHDPAGNVFDLSQQGMKNRSDVYVEGDQEQDRRVKHFTLRTVDPATVTRFYREIFELLELEKPAGDPSSYLTDGRVTLVVSPWHIVDYKGTGIERPALDHIGFEVESVEAVKRDLDTFTTQNPALAPKTSKKAEEQEIRFKLFSKCSYGQYYFSDPDGVSIDVAAR